MKLAEMRILWLAVLFVGAFVLGTVSTSRFRDAVLPGPDPFWTEASAPALTTDEQSNISIYERASPATVNITSTVLQQGWFFEVYPSSESGSGFLIDSEGRILTNHHVIRGNAPQIEVTLLLDDDDNIRYPATVLAADEINDLALIQIDAKRDLPWLPLGDSDALQVGRKVLAIGNPFGLEGSLTTGVISSLDRSIRSEDGILEDMIQTDAAINPGNSGGPLLDNAGNVVGVNTAIVGSANVGIGFAMPISRAKPLLEFVRSGGQSQKPEHPGFRVQFVSGRLAQALKLPAAAFLVVEVESGTPAAEAGLRGATREVLLGNYRIPWGGDIIIAVDGRQVTSRRLLEQSLGLKRGGDTWRLRVLRGDQEADVELTLRSDRMGL